MLKALDQIDERNQAIHLYRREVFIIISLSALTIVLFAIALFVSNAFRRQQNRLANEYFNRGEVQLSASHANRAIMDFRTALSFTPENRNFRLRLAQALTQAGHDKEATVHFKDLWESEPGDGELNLELARLAERAGNEVDALRFFHGAIYGLWNNDPEANRQRARLELINFLLREKSYTQAQSELLGLAASIPPVPGMNIQVATLFAEAGDNIHALQFFRKALHEDRDDHDALLGIAQASFALGNYPNAVEYFRKAAAQKALPPGAQSQFQTAELVMQIDPYIRGLSVTERRNRTLAAFTQAGNRLRICAADKGLQSQTASAKQASPYSGDLSQWDSLQRGIKNGTLKEDTALMDQVMDFVYRIEEDTETSCGTPLGKDMALLLLAQQRSGAGK